MATTEPAPPALATHPRRGTVPPGPAPVGRVGRGPVGDVRRRNPLWLTSGVLLVVLCALGGALLFSRADERTKVLVAAAEMRPGEPLETADLRVAEIAVSGDVAVVPPERADELVGMTPLGRIPAGTLLNPAMFTSDAPLAAGEMIVGAALPPGAAPMSQLDVGAAVELLYTAEGSGVGVVPAEVLGRGTVWAVEPLATGDTWVSLRVSDEVGRTSAQAEQQGALRVVLVGGS
jgi:SAF domain